MSRGFSGILLATVLLFTGCASDSSDRAFNLEGKAEAGIYQVSGAVLHPGSFNLPPGKWITLGEAITRSGGPKPANSWDDGADMGAVRLERVVHGSVVQYTLIAYPGGRDEGFPVKAGDFIKVPKRPFSSTVPNPLPFAQ